MLEKLQESIDKEQKETSSSKTVVEVLLQRMVSVDELLHCDFTGLKRIR